MSEALDISIEAREVAIDDLEGAVVDFTTELDLETDITAEQAPVGEIEALGVGVVVAAIIRWAWPVIVAKVLELVKDDVEKAVQWLYEKLKELIGRIGDKGDVVLVDKASGKSVQLRADLPDDALKEMAHPDFFSRFDGPIIAYDDERSAWVSSAA